jgi:hypothetical protein
METPRRNRLDLNTPAEIAIYNAMQEVEKVGAAPVLTEITTLLEKAKNILADYIEGLPESKLPESNTGIKEAMLWAYNLRSGASAAQADLINNNLETLFDQYLKSDQPIVAPVNLREELIKFASRNDDRNVNPKKGSDKPAIMRLVKEAHERTVDEYLQTKTNQ